MKRFFRSSLVAALSATAFACTTSEDAPRPGDVPDAQPSAPDARTPEDAGAPDAASVEAGEATDAVPPEPYSVWRQTEPIYELYPRHFSAQGNFAGVEAKLAELKALGIGIVWLLPVNEIGSIVPANGGQATDAPWGNPYAVKSYETVNAEYGTDADLSQLVATAHGLGMRVILDWVPNHTAWDNALVVDHPDWYVRVNDVIQPVQGFPWVAQLDWQNQDLRAYMTSVMVSWLQRFDIDGFRIDFAHGMPLDFFTALRPALEAVKPVFLLAEAGDPAFHPAFDMTYDWDVYPLFGDVASGADSVSAIDDALLYKQLVPYGSMPDALIMRMTYNHDDNGVFRLQDRYLGGIKTFAVLASTLPGKPMVFDGQEVGMGVDVNGAVAESAPLGHDPSVKIDWTDTDGYRPFYTKLLQLFRANSALHHAGCQDFRKIDTSPGDRPYAFVRRDGATAVVVVVVNLSGNDYPSVVLQPAPNVGSIDGVYEELFTGTQATLSAGMAMPLGPWEYRVYVQGPLAP
jgi:alpha-amylase